MLRALPLLRKAVTAHDRKNNLSTLARDLGISNEALYSFAIGSTTLAADRLQVLAFHLWGGNTEFNPECNLLRPARKAAPRPLGNHPPPITHRQSPRP
jgi:hypothetical protein